MFDNGSMAEVFSKYQQTFALQSLKTPLRSFNGQSDFSDQGFLCELLHSLWNFLKFFLKKTQVIAFSMKYDKCGLDMKVVKMTDRYDSQVWLHGKGGRNNRCMRLKKSIHHSSFFHNLLFSGTFFQFLFFQEQNFQLMSFWSVYLLCYLMYF